MSGEDPQTPKDFVQSGWTWVQGLSLNVLGKAFTALSNLENLQIGQIPTEVTYEANIAPGTFVPPPAPITPHFRDLQYTLPTAEQLNLPALSDFGPAPGEPNFDRFVYAAPGDVPAAGPPPLDPTELRPSLDAVTMPASPAPIPDPQFFSVVIPPAPSIIIPPFIQSRPQHTMQAPGHTFSFVETAYTSDSLDAIKSKLSVMLSTGSALDVDVETAIFDRGRGREDKLAAKAIQEVSQEWASRGFDMPTGFEARQMLEVRQKNQDSGITFNREHTIEMAKIAIENVKFAAAQGITLEGTLIQAHMQIMDRALLAARTAEELAISLYNAKVADFRNLVELYVADGTLYNLTALEPAKVRSQLYRDQIAGQEAIGNLDKSMADVYVAKVQGVTTLRKSDIDAALGTLQVNLQKLEQARLLIQNLAEENRTKEIEWGGYRARLEAALAPLKAEETLAQVFSSRVQAWSTKGNIAIEEQKNGLQIELAKLEKLKTLLQVTIADIQGKTSIEENKARALTAEAAVFGAAGQIAQAEAATLDRGAELVMTNANNRAQISLKNAETNSQNMLAVLNLLLKKFEGLSTVYSQLAASVLSGVKFGADYNGHLAFNYDRSKRFDYNGSTDDANPDF